VIGFLLQPNSLGREYDFSGAAMKSRIRKIG